MPSITMSPVAYTGVPSSEVDPKAENPYLTTRLTTTIEQASDVEFDVLPHFAETAFSTGAVPFDIPVQVQVWKNNTDKRTVYKGLTKKLGFQFTRDTPTYRGVAAESLIDNQEWAPKWHAYNMKNTTSSVSVFGSDEPVTIEQFFDEEKVGRWDKWFTDVILGDSVKETLAPAFSTLKKGFMQIVQELLSPYPQFKWYIEYTELPVTLPTPVSVFPVGKLIIFDASIVGGDTTTGAAEHTLIIGDKVSGVVDMNLEYTSEQCASTVKIFGRGRMTDRYEVLTPVWSPKDETIHTLSVKLAKGKKKDDTISPPIRVEFVRDFKLWAYGPKIKRAGSSATIETRTRLWPGADFRIDVENCVIQFLVPKPKAPEEGALLWWWVSETTGEVYSDNLAGTTNNVFPAGLRRPIAHDDQHIAENTKFFEMEFDSMGDMPYRKYQTKWPIIDFRIGKSDVLLPDGSTVTKITQQSNSFDVYVPNAVADILAAEEKIPTEHGTVYTPPTPVATTSLGQLITSTNITLSSGIETLSLRPSVEKEIVDNLANEVTRRSALGLPPTPILSAITAQCVRLDNTGLSDVVKSDILKNYTLASSGASFEEGSNTVILSGRQLACTSKWYDKANASALDVADPQKIGWLTWTVLARYTSWEQQVEIRDQTVRKLGDYEIPAGVGMGRTYRGQSSTCFQYIDATKDLPVVTFDNTEQLSDLANAAAKYYSTPYWQGSITVAVNTKELLPIVPFRLGDSIKLTGNIDAPLLDARSLIVGIDYTDIQNCRVTLALGRVPPKKNPYLPRPAAKVQLDIEGADYGKAGLQDL